MDFNQSDKEEKNKHLSGGDASNDAHDDSGHVSSKPGDGWGSDSSEFSAQDEHSSYANAPAERTSDLGNHDTGHHVETAGLESRAQETKVPVHSMRTAPKTPVLHVESHDARIRTLEQKHRWLWALWWILFILIVLGVMAAAGFNIWDTKLLRDDYFQSETTLHGRIDSNDSQNQSRLQDRAHTLEVRIDQLWEKMADLQAENAALKAKTDSIDMMCQRACNQSAK